MKSFALSFVIFFSLIGGVFSQSVIFNSQSRVYLSEDGGSLWKEIFPFKSAVAKKSVNAATYFTASDRSPINPDHILLGTSFQGIYESLDAGKTYTLISDTKAFNPINQGLGYYEEIGDIQYIDKDSFAFKTSFDIKTFIYNRKTAKLSESPFTFSHPSLKTSPDPLLIELPIAIKNNSPEEKAKRRLLVQNKEGLYLNTTPASSKLDKNIALIKKYGLNSLVVDFKNDEGYITYDSKLDIAKEAKAIRVKIDPKTIVEKAHKEGIWVIARIVVFKDPKLYAYKKNEYALYNKWTKKPWGVIRDGVQVESWVDPYSPIVHEYAIAVAQEALSFGVDEIQFDYIRFPSDGDTAAIMSKHRASLLGNLAAKEESLQERVFALSTFLKTARESISAPIATDVFGFNGWARMSYLGQDIQAYSQYVDVIQPMAYPSHYARSFLGSMKYFDRAEYILDIGTRRGIEIIQDRALIRPYVQAFLIGNERSFSDPQLFEYLERQIIGLRKGGGSGFTLWNNMGNYYMINPKSFTELMKK